MLKNPNGTSIRNALTVVEVLFALGIILVGLVGIAAMIPFAARQASESYSITQNLAKGESAIGMASSIDLSQPSEVRPWQIVEDVEDIDTNVGDSNRSVFTSLRSIYDGPDAAAGNAVGFSLYRHQFVSNDYPVPTNNIANRDFAWVNMNRAVGTCFYMDPHFWGEQSNLSNGKVLASAWTPFRRTRFPYFAETSSPPPIASQTPRLWRVSLRDNHVPITQLNNGWMSSAAAKALTTSYSGDVNPLTSSLTNDRNVRRDFISIQNSGALIDGNLDPVVIKSAFSETSRGSWAMMVCPEEETPIIPKSAFPIVSTDYRTVPVPFFPQRYNVSLVVYGKRNVNELVPDSPVVTGQVLPEAEILASVSWDGSIDEPARNSVFEVTLASTPGIEAKVIAGDWIMLSRYVLHFDSATAAWPMRQRHRWYRVVNTPTEGTFPMNVRLSGLPWDWTVDEIKSASLNGVPLGSLQLRNTTTTVATIVPNVLHVFQRIVNVE
jgi:hypothetical protein